MRLMGLALPSQLSFLLLQQTHGLCIQCQSGVREPGIGPQPMGVSAGPFTWNDCQLSNAQLSIAQLIIALLSIA